MIERVVKRQTGSYHIGRSIVGDDGAPVTPSAPVSVLVLDSAGITVHSGAASSGVGQLSAQVQLPELGVYRVRWTDAAGGEWASSVEVCGGVFFEISALRLVDQAYADVSRYPSELLRSVRSTVEERFESVAGVSFVPRGARIRVVGDGTPRLQLQHVACRRVRAVSVSGVAKSSDEISRMKLREWGALDLDGASWPVGELVEVAYEHGLDECPAPVSQAALIAAPEYLTRKALAARAMSEVTEFGSIDLAVAGYSRPVGIPEVDRVLMDFGRRGRMVG